MSKFEIGDWVKHTVDDLLSYGIVQESLAVTTLVQWENGKTAVAPNCLLKLIGYPKYKVGDVLLFKDSCSYKQSWDGCTITKVTFDEGKIQYFVTDASPLRREGLVLEDVIESLFSPPSFTLYQQDEYVSYLDHSGKTAEGSIISEQSVSGIDGCFILPLSSDKPVWIATYDILDKIEKPSVIKQALLVVNQIKKVYLNSDFDEDSQGYIIEDLIYKLEGILHETN